jgi:hypothetical protein
MKHATKTRQWKVYIETTYEQPQGSPEPRVGDPLMLRGTGGLPLVGQITELSEEFGTAFVSFYEKKP